MAIDIAARVARTTDTYKQKFFSQTMYFVTTRKSQIFKINGQDLLQLSVLTKSAFKILAPTGKRTLGSQY